MTMPWLPFGTVYGTLLNFRAERDALGARMDEPPYKGAPKAPVLYIKTANTWTPHGRSITLPAHVQQAAEWAEPVNWMNCLVLHDDAPVTAEALQQSLTAAGIETRPFFSPIPLLDIYRDGGSYPVSERLARTGINLPSGPRLGLDEVETVIKTIRTCLS